MFVYKPNLENQGLFKFRFCIDLCWSWWQLRLGMFVYKLNLENQGLLKFRFCFDLCWWQLRFVLRMTNIKVWIFTNGHKTISYREFIEFMFNVYKICSKSSRCNTLVIFQNCSSSILKFSLIDSLHLSYPKLLFRGRGGHDRYSTVVRLIATYTISVYHH